MSTIAPTRPSVVTFELPIVEATPDSLNGYGLLVDDYEAQEIEIVPWPAPGRRPLDPGTGDQGGVAEGIFEFWWAGEILYGRNHAVESERYLLGWSRDPDEASEVAENPDRSKILLWHANYHPDGGQLFYPANRDALVAPLALPGDDIKPENFVAFYFDGSRGLYIHPNIWHEGVFPLAETARFFDKQGKVHARISCDLLQEFGTYLSVPLRRP
jgi:ureidoglycolate lyase